MKKLFYISLLFLAMCKKDDTPNNLTNDDNPVTSSMEFFIDDEPFYMFDDRFILRGLNGLWVENIEGNNGSKLGLIFKSLEHETLGSFTFLMEIENWDWQIPPLNGILTKTYDAYAAIPGPNTACSDMATENLCDLVYFSFTRFSLPDPTTNGRDNAHYYNGNEDGSSSGTVTITSVNTTDSTVSGSIDVVLKRALTDAPDPELFPENLVLRGAFEDIPYTVHE